MEAHQLVGGEGEHGVGLAVAVAELNLISTGGPAVHDGASLASDQAVPWKIFQEGDYG